MKYIATTLLLIALLVSSAGSTPSTHIWGPSTDIQPYLKWHITGDIYLPTETQTGGTLIPPVSNLGLTVGILPFERIGCEVGFDHKGGLGNLDRKPVYYNLKLGVPETALVSWSPAIACGGYDFGTEADLTDFNLLYLKVAKTIKSGDTDFGRISAGYFTGNKVLLLDQNGEKDNAGLMVAWERSIPEFSDKLWVCAEYMGTNSSYGTSNLGFAWKFAENVGVLLGYDIPNNSQLPATLTFQVDIDF